MIDPPCAIAIAGAGSVGCYLGGVLAAQGRRVALLARPSLADALSRHGLALSDLDGRSQTVPPGAFRATHDPAEALSRANVVLVTVKSGDTAEIAALVGEHAPSDAIVVSFQNGVGNVDMLGAALSPTRVVAGMVPFNVTQTIRPGEAPHFHRGTEGRLHIARQVPGLAACLATDGVACVEHLDMVSVGWSKLVLNLNNALNALSGLPLYDQLSHRSWRVELADQMDEAIGVIRASGIRLVRIDGVHPALAAKVLRLPNFLFHRVARRMLAIDRKARSSMAEDIERGRKTEIDYLQGAVIGAAERLGRDAPKCRDILERIKTLAGNGEAVRRPVPTS